MHHFLQATCVRNVRLAPATALAQCNSFHKLETLAGANGLASLVLQCLWESFALPVIVEPLVTAVGSSQQGSQPQPVKGGFWATSSCKHLQALLTTRIA